MRNTQKIKTPEALMRMLQRYDLSSLQDQKNAIKEIVQEIALLGLWRAKFFEKAAFYGGTALRILYQLDRFSEDLDFSLLEPNSHFDLARYEKAIVDELHSLGFMARIQKKKKTTQSVVDSAFIKINTTQHLLLIGIPEGMNKNIHSEQSIKIRIEVDTDPPADGAITESKLLLQPFPFSLKTLRIEDLFAGKVHTTLCREWKGRVKGRDWYDLVWFISRDVPLNLFYLEQRMRQTSAWTKKQKMTPADLKDRFEQKIESLDIQSAKADIINFIRDSSQIELWSQDFFRQIIQKINFLDVL
ncbi:MAG: hypothetical protein S4CHLAM2_17820 [Chlamydiales bacterium]|nr:hypothetical protein [Chlamydiales bacterium]